MMKTVQTYLGVMLETCKDDCLTRALANETIIKEKIKYKRRITVGTEMKSLYTVHDLFDL